MPATMSPHAALWAAGKLEARVQLTAWRAHGVEPEDTVIVMMDLRGEIAQGIFDALVDDPHEVASRLDSALPGEPATVAVVVPTIEGKIVLECMWPDRPEMIIELIGRPAGTVPVLTVTGEDEPLLTFAEAMAWRPE